MITPDTFYKQTNANFATVFEKIDNLVAEVAGQRETLNTHLAVGTALEKKDSDVKKRNWFITGIVVTISFGLWKVLEFILT